VSQRRIAMVRVDGTRLKLVWIDEHGSRTSERILGTFEGDAGSNAGLLELLEASLDCDPSEAGSNIRIQVESNQLYEILSRSDDIRPLLIPPTEPGASEEGFGAWPSGNVDAQEERPRTRGASDNGITAEGGSNE
jgi:hypothetical protein